jgi:hypothetical protein
VLGFESVWNVSRVGPNSVSVGDSKFESFGLVRSHAHLQCFSVASIGATRPHPLFYGISEDIWFSVLLLLCVILGH